MFLAQPNTFVQGSYVVAPQAAPQPQFIQMAVPGMSVPAIQQIQPMHHIHGVQQLPLQQVQGQAIPQVQQVQGVQAPTPLVQYVFMPQVLSTDQPPQAVPVEPQAPAPASEPTPQVEVIRLRDPLARDNLAYDVPISRILPSRGLASYLKKVDRRLRKHHPTICTVFLENKCRLGSRCKSFHLAPGYVEQLREEHGALLDDTFLYEVPVRDSDNSIICVRYGSMLKTAGLAALRQQCSAGQAFPAGNLCAMFTLSGRCQTGQACANLHVRGSARELATRRTPCCHFHGDDNILPTGQQLPPKVCITVRADADGKEDSVSLPLMLENVAITDGLACTVGPFFMQNAPISLTMADLCPTHVMSCCTTGRKCNKVHVCRAWAARNGIVGHGKVPELSLQAKSAE